MLKKICLLCALALIVECGESHAFIDKIDCYRKPNNPNATEKDYTFEKELAFSVGEPSTGDLKNYYEKCATKVSPAVIKVGDKFYSKEDIDAMGEKLKESVGEKVKDIFKKI